MDRFTAMVMLLSHYAVDSFSDRITKQKATEKPCKVCGTPTTHKKQFCSAECCRKSRHRSDT